LELVVDELGGMGGGGDVGGCGGGVWVEEMVMEVVDLKKKMKRKKVGLVVVFVEEGNGSGGWLWW